MTRQEYMQQLAALLAAMPEAERRDALDYYEEYFDAAGPEKEAQTIQELGSPQNVAEKIWEGTGAQFGTPMPDNSMPEQGSRRRKSPVWIVLAILAILIVVLLVFIGSFKIVTKYQYSIAESATAEEVPPQETTGEANGEAAGGTTENMDESTDENTETAITRESAKSESTNRLESSTMTLDAKQVQTMVLDLDCGEVAFVRSNAADEITLRFENFYSDWLAPTRRLIVTSPWAFSIVTRSACTVPSSALPRASVASSCPVCSSSAYRLPRARSACMLLAFSVPRSALPRFRFSSICSSSISGRAMLSVGVGSLPEI